MTTSEQIQQLFHSQLSGHAQEISRKVLEVHGNVEGLETTIQEYLATANLDMNVGGKTKSKSKSNAIPKSRKKTEPEDRCQARVWGDGDGTSQCSFSACSNGLCTKHSKAEAECAIPCQVTPEGKVRGLYMGRITDFQDGQANIPPYKDSNNIVRINWPKGEAKSVISSGLENGECVLGPPCIKKSIQSTKKKKSIKAAEDLALVSQKAVVQVSEMEELFGLSSDEETSVEHPIQQPVADLVAAIEEETSAEQPAEKETSAEQPAEKETSAEQPAEKETSVEPVVEEETSVEQPAEEEQSTGVDEMVYEQEGKDDITFHVETGGSTIYYLDCDEDDDDYGTEIGEWKDGKPELTEEWKHLLN